MAKKIDVLTVAKIAGTVLTVGGTLLSAWTGKKDQDKTLAKLVDEALKTKTGEQ